jgi:4-hydroxybenzoate polyprenyltransferase
MLGTGLISFGVGTALVFDFKVLVLALLFVAINLAYTFRFKTVPYLEILLNTITHPLRFAAGLWLAGSWEHWPLLATWTLAIFAITTLKRIKEIREAGPAVRPVLKHYDESTLKNLITASLVLLLGISPFTRDLDFVLTGVWFALTLVVVVGYFRSPLLKRLEEHLWR